MYNRLKSMAIDLEKSMVILGLLPETASNDVQSVKFRIKIYQDMLYDGLKEAVFSWAESIKFKYARIRYIKTHNASEWGSKEEQEYSRLSMEYWLEMKTHLKEIQFFGSYIDKWMAEVACHVGRLPYGFSSRWTTNRRSFDMFSTI
jgi:hypothetical protein